MNDETPATAPQLQLRKGPSRFVGGYYQGLRQPSLLVTVVVVGEVNTLIQHLPAVWELEAVWTKTTDRPSLPTGWRQEADGLAKSARWLAHWTVQLQRAAGLPVFEEARLLRSSPGGDRMRQAVVQIPVAPGRQAAAEQAFAGALRCFNQCLTPDQASSPEGDSHEDPFVAAALLAGVIKGLAAHAPTKKNTPAFLQAAFKLGIPVTAIGNEVFEYGHGCRARWLDSSLTDAVSALTCDIGRDKQWAAGVLRRAGIPAPAHQKAKDANDAVRIAERLGWPVVVKPANLSRGVGVAAGLTNEQEVREAYELARQHSKSILVEKHVHGRDYRVTVFQGAMIWACERIPGGVVGDGRSTIAQLLEKLNADPRRSGGGGSSLEQLVWDEEARELLAKENLSLDSIPAEGRFVLFRRVSNISRGGTPITVTAVVHPENAQLAVRAAQAMRIDLAGVDLLIPDIRHSWRETGAGVCEVNSQPVMGRTTGPQVFGEILEKLLPFWGRLPTAVVLGAAPESRLAEQVAAQLRVAGRGVGWSNLRGAAVGNEWLTPGKVNSLEAGDLLLRDRRVEAIVLSVNDAEVLRHGLPFDRYDWLILAGMHCGLQTAARNAAPADAFREVLAGLLPACVGKVVSVAGSGVTVAGHMGLTSAKWLPQPLPANEAAGWLVAEMLQNQSGAPADHS